MTTEVSEKLVPKKHQVFGGRREQNEKQKGRHKIPSIPVREPMALLLKITLFRISERWEVFFIMQLECGVLCPTVIPSLVKIDFSLGLKI